MNHYNLLYKFTLVFSYTCLGGILGSGISKTPCETGWSYFEDGNKCIKVFQSPKSWDDASKHCRQLGGRLLTIHNQETNTFLSGILPDKFVGLIGLNDKKKEGKFVWSDEETFYTNWRAGEPNDHNGDEDCVALQTDDGKWNDLPCQWKSFFVCESIGPNALPCQRGWSYFEEGAKCVRAFKTPRTFSEASGFCHHLGGRLVSIHDQATNDFVSSLEANFEGFIGLSDRQTEGRYVWSDGRVLVKTPFVNWHTGEPNNNGDREDCVNVHRDDWTWNDYPCYDPFTLPFMCEATADMDECVDGNGGCDQICVNTLGSWKCACLAGYTLINDTVCMGR